MGTETFRRRLLAGEPLVGTLLTVAEPVVADALAGCGFDWLFVDAEHGALTVRDVQTAVQVVGDRCATLVRVAENAPPRIAAALDTGCAGVIVPQVNSAADARRAVAAARYPPAGSRSVGIGRAHGYGRTFAEYLARANDEVCVVVQAEHRLAAEHIADIAAVPGVDAVFVGPYDLSGSLDALGRLDDPAVEGAVRGVLAACATAGLPVGIFVGTVDAAAARREQGFGLLAVGSDVSHLIGAAAATAAALCGGAGSRSTPG
ncbi:MAG TPA: aldolase/citrate lyase family protein [Pseudonocardia sp.]|nr:aldolase/citrate lyase family protein [Pseudonocardia sp.]